MLTFFCGLYTNTTSDYIAPERKRRADTKVSRVRNEKIAKKNYMKNGRAKKKEKKRKKN